MVKLSEPQSGQAPRPSNEGKKEAVNLTPTGLIAEVQDLYVFGVKVGLLKSDDGFKVYLNEMRTKYQQVSSLGTGVAGSGVLHKEGI